MHADCRSQYLDKDSWFCFIYRWVLAARSRPCASCTRLFENTNMQNRALCAPPPHRSNTFSVYYAKHSFANIPANFRENSKRPQRNRYSEAWGTLIHEKLDVENLVSDFLQGLSLSRSFILEFTFVRRIARLIPHICSLYVTMKT